jgi:hypothetical protein
VQEDHRNIENCLPFNAPLLCKEELKLTRGNFAQCNPLNLELSLNWHREFFSRIRRILNSFKEVKNVFVSIPGHSLDDLDGVVEAETIGASEGGDQPARQLHRQPLLSLRKRILQKTSIETLL